jgi:hypothetical protein
LAADDVAGALGGDHDDIDIGGRDHGLEVNGEAVGKEESLPPGQVRADIAVIDIGDLRIRHGDEDDIAALDGLGGIDDLEAFLLGHRAGFAARVEADDDLDAAILEIERMGVALGAEADDGAGLALEGIEGGVFVCVNLGCHK